MKVEKVYINGMYYKKWFYTESSGKNPTVCIDKFLYSFIEDANAFKLFTYLGSISSTSKNKTVSKFTFEDIDKKIKINKEMVLNCINYLIKLEILKVVNIDNKSVTCELYELIPTDNPNIEYVETAYDLFGDDFIEEYELSTYETKDKETDKKNKTKSRNDVGYNNWKRSVLERDENTCQLCGLTNEETILNVHHIEKYSENKDLRTNVDNGITLCYKCHLMVFGKEKEYEEYFKAIINNKKN